LVEGHIIIIIIIIIIIHNFSDESLDLKLCIDGLYPFISPLASQKYTSTVRKVKNVCAYNPRSCFIVPDQSCGVFSRV